MKINVTIEIDDEELRKLFNLKSEEEYPGNKIDKTETVSQYARWFDESCIGWTKDAEYNMHFLKDRQNYCDNLLRSKGHLFLNEVYDILGIPRTLAGQRVGWIYNKENFIGANFVDFGLDNERNKEFLTGFKNTAILDFNVDGDILNYI